MVFEAVNVPQVMTPWELRDHIHFILSHVEPHPQLAVVQQLTGRFIAGWQAVWARYGDDRAGWNDYRRLLDGFMAGMEVHAASLQLSNGMQFISTLRSMVAGVALADRRHPALPDEPREPVGVPPGTMQ
jgi:hypothetical protein